MEKQSRAGNEDEGKEEEQAVCSLPGNKREGSPSKGPEWEELGRTVQTSED